MNLLLLVLVSLLIAGCGDESECDPATFKDECLDEVTLRHCGATNEQSDFYRIFITDCSKVAGGGACVPQRDSDEFQCGPPPTE